MKVTKEGRGRTRLLNKLWKFQLEKGFISDADVRRLSRELDIPVVEITGVISFYHFFSRKPRGKFAIYLNNSIVSEIKGFEKVKEAFEKETGTKFGSVDPTGTFGLFETSCIGLSDQEPAALINFVPFVNLTPKKIKNLISGLKSGKSLKKLAEPVTDHIRYTNGENAVLFKPYEIAAALKNMLKMSPYEVIEEMKWSQLSGRGGAFFPTGLKWDFCRKALGMQKYIICNADEGEPGTFKDRVLLNQMPGLLLEGMITAAYAVGATKGVIYLRAEYRYLKDKLEDTIQKFYDIGLLGVEIMGHQGFDFDVRVQMGAGAYVCGEETALIESLEGKRGEPRTKIYFPVEKGFQNKPTVVNNVETFCAAARIMEMGAPDYRALGTSKTSGTKLLSISGDCAKPGIYEIEWGMTISEMLDLCGAKKPHFIQFSGPSGTVLSASKDRNRQICREDVMCGGSVMIFNDKRDIFKILTNFSKFFINESCGLCTPCRAGNYLVGRKLEKIDNGMATGQDIAEIKNWSKIIQATSRCGLGKTSTNFILSSYDKFPEVFDEKTNSRSEAEKEFNTEDYIHDYIDFVNKQQGTKV